MSFSLYTPLSVAEAVGLCLEKNGRYLAGGTVSLVNAHKGREIGDALISVEKIPVLHGITLEDSVLTIGACTVMDEIEQSPLVREHAYALWQAAREVGGPQIRNRATIGGNIAAASPASDCVPPLLALDASVNTAGIQGERQIPLRSFFLGKFQTVLEPGELIISVSIPLGAVSSFRKVGKRSALAVSCLCLAAARRNGMTEVAAGAVAAKPLFCEKTSSLLRGNLTPAKMDAAVCEFQTEITPITDRWGDAEYKKQVCINLLRQMLNEPEVFQ